MNYLIVVDMQTDFIDGALGTAEATAILPLVVQKLQGFDGTVLFTRDTHEENYLETQEGKKLPVRHCIRGTDGWRLHPDIEKFCREKPFDKPTFGSVALGERLRELSRLKDPVESITLVGLCTDICVIANALLLKSFFPEIPIIVDASCCAGVTRESHLRALAAMRSCQIDIING